MNTKNRQSKNTNFKWGHLFDNERGVETIEWIGLAALVLALLVSAAVFLSSSGGRLGESITTTLSELMAGQGNAATPGEGAADLNNPGISGSGSSGPGFSQPGIGNPGMNQPGGSDPGVNQPDAGSDSNKPDSDPQSPNGRVEANCPDCSPDWLEHSAEFAWDYLNPIAGTLDEAVKMSRIVPYGGKYVKVFKGAPGGLAPGRYLATNAKITPYTTASGVFKYGLTSGSAWGANGIFAVVSNLIEFGFFNEKPIGSSDFFASITVDTVFGVVAGAAGAAIVTGILAAAGVATAPIWLVGLATAIVATGLVMGVDWITCKITGKGATTWAKEGVKKLYEGGFSLVKSGWNRAKKFFGF